MTTGDGCCLVLKMCLGPHNDWSLSSPRWSLSGPGRWSCYTGLTQPPLFNLPTRVPTKCVRSTCSASVSVGSVKLRCTTCTAFLCVTFILNQQILSVSGHRTGPTRVFGFWRSLIFQQIFQQKRKMTLPNRFSHHALEKTLKTKTSENFTYRDPILYWNLFTYGSDFVSDPPPQQKPMQVFASVGRVEFLDNENWPPPPFTSVVPGNRKFPPSCPEFCCLTSGE